MTGSVTAADLVSRINAGPGGPVTVRPAAGASATVSDDGVVRTASRRSGLDRLTFTDNVTFRLATTAASC